MPRLKITITSSEKNNNEKRRPRKRSVVSSDDDSNLAAKRISRKEHEKQRRDKLNFFISELANNLPIIQTADRRMEKSSILRLAVNFLKVHQGLAKRFQFKWCPNFLDNSYLANALLETLSSFILVVDSKTEIIFVSETINNILNYKLADILGYPLLNFLHVEDHKLIKDIFENTMYKNEQHFTITLRLMKNEMNHINDHPNKNYVTVELYGYLSEPKDQDTEVYLVSIARLRDTTIEMFPAGEQPQNQWITQHSLDGNIIYSDPRGCLITGFFSNESVGFSPYSLIHPDDIGPIVLKHNIFLTTGDIPITYFRMFTKSRDLLHIRTTPHMVVDMWTSKPRYIVNIKEVLDEKEGKTEIEKQRFEILQNKTGLQLENIIEGISNMTTTCNTSSVSSMASPSNSQFSKDDDSYCKLNFDLENEEGSDQVKVVVGDVKYKIDLSLQELFPRKGYNVSKKTIVDSGQNKPRNVTLVKPEFDVPYKEISGEVTEEFVDNIDYYFNSSPVICDVNFDGENSSFNERNTDVDSPKSQSDFYYNKLEVFRLLLNNVENEMNLENVNYSPSSLNIDCLSETDEKRLELYINLTQKITEINDAIKSKETSAANLRKELIKAQQANDVELINRLSLSAEQLTSSRQIYKKTLLILKENLQTQVINLKEKLKQIIQQKLNNTDEDFGDLLNMPLLDLNETIDFNCVDIDLTNDL